MSLPFLQSFGLTQNEASVYEALLGLGVVPAWQIVQEVKLKRPTVYKALNNLEKMGLVTKNEKAKVIRFAPVAPQKLLELADRKFTSLERAKENLNASLPQLTSNYIMAVEKPVVRTFEGFAGLKEIYEDTLKENQPIYAVLQATEIDPTLHKWLETTYVRKRVKQNIPAQVIVASGRGAKEYTKKDKEQLRTTVMVSNDLFPFQHEVDVYGNKVAYIHYKKDEPLIGIVINHPSIAQTMKAWFDLAWQGASHLT